MTTTPVIGIHLDLKYAIASKAYLNEWVAQLPSLGINTLLIEYEDKFPFHQYPFLRHVDAFTDDQLKTFLDTARGVGLRVVPLVQSLSHLEFALAHDELAHLRELPHVPTQIDTSNPEAIQFVLDLMDDVLTFHESDDWFHIGGDEAWHLGSNERSKQQIESLGKLGLWAQIEKQAIDHVIDAGKRPIIWDDAFWADPSTLEPLGLPKQTILMAWGYAKQYGDNIDGYVKRIETYRASGYDAIGAPCLNWGVLTARHDHCLGNTAAWADAMRQAGPSDVWGVINTAWNSFHVLPHAENFYIQATAAAMDDPGRVVDRAWQDRALGDYFGADAGGVADALQTFGEIWEWPVENFGRPITPIVYGLMDMSLWYGTQDRRMAEGSYPLDLDDVDFAWIYRKKCEILRDANGEGEVSTKLRELIGAYEPALALLTSFTAVATNHQAEAAWFAFAAKMKLTHARILLHELAGEGGRVGLASTWQTIGDELDTAITPFVDEWSLRVLRRLWWEPIALSLVD